MQKNASALLEMGAKTVVIKGVVHEGEQVIRNYLASAADGGEVEEVVSELLPYMLHGTGDLFASALTAAISPAAPRVRLSRSPASWSATLCASRASSPTSRCAASRSSPPWAKWRHC